MPRHILVKRRHFSPDLATHPLPYPKTTLPAAGGTFTDPTFGSTLIRVTDATNAPTGVIMFSDGADMMWNCDGTLFVLYIAGSGTRLYGFNRTTYAITDYGAMNTITLFDGAQWHPTETGSLYACDGVSKIYKFTNLPTNPGQTPALSHDFAAQLPTIDNANSRIGLSDAGRYLSLMGDSGASPVTQEYDYVWVWDTSGGGSLAATLNTPAQFGAGTYLHSSDMVPGDTYIRLGGTTGAFGSVLWNWQANTFSGSLTDTDQFSGHKSFGPNIVYNPGVGTPFLGEEVWVSRACATPTSSSTLLAYPLRSAIHTAFWDSHGSKVLPTGGFTDDPQYAGSPGHSVGGGGARQPWVWTLHAGAVWKVTAFSTFAASGYATTFGPDTMWYTTSTMTLVGGIPTNAGEFFYNTGTDVFYAWLPDGSDPNSAAYIGILGWVPCVDEILYNVLISGTWVTRRYCHHRARGDATDFGTYPLAHPDPQGRFVLFSSNWDVHGGRVDAFIVDGDTSRS